MRTAIPIQRARSDTMPTPPAPGPESKLTNDEMILAALRGGSIVVNCATGQVFRQHPRKLKEIRGGINRYGYLQTALEIPGTHRKYRTVRFNRIVWIAAYGCLPPPKMVVAHENNIKTDNRISNLKLKTNKQNIEQAARDGLYGNLVAMDRVKMRIESRLGKNQAQIAKTWKVDPSTVSRALKAA
jgi:HNH endonuclease